MTYQIVHKDPKRHIRFACGFHSLERAQKWIKNFNPQHYTDKTFKREDLIIVEEK